MLSMENVFELLARLHEWLPSDFSKWLLQVTSKLQATSKSEVRLKLLFRPKTPAPEALGPKL